MPPTQKDPITSIISNLAIAKDFGFEWPNHLLRLDQIKSEYDEINNSLEHNETKERLQEEVEIYYMPLYLFVLFLILMHTQP
jgi:hypothetical protein